MYAYVKYVDDGMEAIVPTNLVKDFSPTTTKAFKKTTKKAFWYAEDGSMAGYYSAEIRMLGETEDDLIRAILDENVAAVPRILKSDDVPESQLPSSQIPTRKRRKNNEKESREKDLRIVLAKRAKMDCSNDEQQPSTVQGTAKCDMSCEEMLATEKRLKELTERVKFLEQQVANLQSKLQEKDDDLAAERNQCRRLQDTLLKKFEVIPAPAKVQKGVPTDCDLRASAEHLQAAWQALEDDQHWAISELQPVPHVVHSNQQGVAAVMEGCTAPAKGQAEDEAAPLHVEQVKAPVKQRVSMKHVKRPFTTEESRNSSSVALFVTVDDKVHLGNDVFVPQEKLEWALRSKKDSAFCREMSRQLWTEAELQGRSLSGVVSNRFAKTGLPPKPALTPQKLQALARRSHKLAL